MILSRVMKMNEDETHLFYFDAFWDSSPSAKFGLKDLSHNLIIIALRSVQAEFAENSRVCRKFKSLPKIQVLAKNLPYFGH